MKDIFSFEFTSSYKNNVVFDIVKDNKLEEESYEDKILTQKIFGLEVEDILKKRGYKLIFNHLEMRKNFKELK